MDFLLELNWLAIGQIILIDLLLGGDNAIIIALACRNLPKHLRVKGILWGTFGAIAIRIVLIAFAMTLLQVPYLKLLGGILLLWIGVKLFAENDPERDVPGSDSLVAAVRTIILADMVMSIDNVVAIASAAEHASGDNPLPLVVFGILISIPIIIWGSALVLVLMNRFPIIIIAGAGLLGYLGGTMMVSDAGIAPWLQANAPYYDLHLPLLDLHFNLPGIAGAMLVIGLGHWLARKTTGPSKS